MVLLFAAIIAEVFKASYQAIPKGQMEAGVSIGLTPSQTFWRIIFPQAFQVALPNMTTAILNLMRDAALAYTIGFVDVMGAGNLLISRNLGNYSLETYTAVANSLLGCGLGCFLLESLVGKIFGNEREIGYGFRLYCKNLFRDLKRGTDHFDYHDCSHGLKFSTSLVFSSGTNI